MSTGSLAGSYALAMAAWAVACAACSVADLPAGDGPGPDAAHEDAAMDATPVDANDAAADTLADGGCPSLCGTANFGDGGLVNGALRGVVEALSAPNVLDGVLGLTQDGKVLHLRGMPSGLFDLLLSAPSDGDGGYVTVDLSAQAGGDASPPFYADRATISFDGTLLVVVTPTSNAFRQAPLVGLALGPVTEGPFGTLNRALPPNPVVGGTLLSPDALTFFYAVLSSSSIRGPAIYSASRASIDDSFGIGVPLPVDLQAFWDTSGISSDGLTLFLERNFTTFSISRCQRSDPWTLLSLFNDGGLSPGLASYWAARPAPDCSYLLTTCGTGGGTQQDICMLPRQP